MCISVVCVGRLTACRDVASPVGPNWRNWAYVNAFALQAPYDNARGPFDHCTPIESSGHLVAHAPCQALTPSTISSPTHFPPLVDTCAH